MSIYIIISQSSRLAAVWTKNILTKQLLLSTSILAYSILLIERNKKIEKYYEQRPNRLPEDSGSENSEVS
jgi:hypothetical protein